MQLILTPEELDRKLKLARQEGYDRGYSSAFKFIQGLINTPNANWAHGEDFKYLKEVRTIISALALLRASSKE